MQISLISTTTIVPQDNGGWARKLIGAVRIRRVQQISRSCSGRPIPSKDNASSKSVAAPARLPLLDETMVGSPTTLAASAPGGPELGSRQQPSAHSVAAAACTLHFFVEPTDAAAAGNAADPPLLDLDLNLNKKLHASLLFEKVLKSSNSFPEPTKKDELKCTCTNSKSDRHYPHGVKTESPIREQHNWLLHLNSHPRSQTNLLHSAQ